MTQFVGYIAASLDGRIADGVGGLDWLMEFGPPEDFGYDDFYAGIDGLVMGRATFEATLSFGDWPYPGKPAWVVTGRPLPELPEGVTAVPSDFVALKSRVAAAGLRRVWVMGGGRTQAGALAAGMFHDLRLFVMPVVLGAGRAVFDGELPPAPARLIEVRNWPRGVTELHYGFGDGDP